MKTLAVFLILSFCLCVFATASECIYMDLTDSIAEPYSKDVFKRYKLQLSGYGGDRMFQVDDLTLYFTGNKKIELTEGRIIMVNLMHEFLVRINAEKKLRPYLNEYPFQPKDLDLSVSLRHDAQKLMNPYIGLISNIDGIIHYSAYHSDEKNKITGIQFTEIHNETYEEALDIVKKAGQLKPF